MSANPRHRAKRRDFLAILGIAGAAAFAGTAVVRRLRSGAKSESSERIRLFELSVEIRRPPEEVFAFVTDLRNDVQWGQRVIQEVHQTSQGPPGIGSTYREVGNIMGLRFDIPIEVTQYEPVRKFGFEAAMGPIRGTGMRSVEGTTDGTRLTITVEGYSSGLSRIVVPVFAYWAEREVRAGLISFKNLLESKDLEESVAPPN